jgi:heterodisulfide reductase subunit C2
MAPISSTSLAGKVNLPTGDWASVINQCFQCSKCSAGCPVAPEMDILPHQLVRLAVLGEVDRIVASKSLWLCLTCHTCGARCPNGIDVPALLDPIRHQVLRSKIKTQLPQVGIFHDAFMRNVKTFGRVHELSLIGIYKMKTGTYFNDMELGMQMFKKGKIHILPHSSSRISDVKAVFRQSGMR